MVTIQLQWQCRNKNSGYLIAWLPCFDMLELKIPRRYLDFLNHVTFSEVVECVFGFTGKFFCVAHNDLDHVPMEDLVSKPLRIHLESAKDL